MHQTGRVALEVVIHSHVGNQATQQRRNLAAFRRTPFAFCATRLLEEALHNVRVAAGYLCARRHDRLLDRRQVPVAISLAPSLDHIVNPYRARCPHSVHIPTSLPSILKLWCNVNPHPFSVAQCTAKQRAQHSEVDFTTKVHVVHQFVGLISVALRRIRAALAVLCLYHALLRFLVNAEGSIHCAIHLADTDRTMLAYCAIFYTTFICRTILCV